MCLRQLWNVRSTIILVLTPIVFLPVPILYTAKAGRCAYALIIMAVYWMTEAIPMAATALLPVVLMPWLGVLGSKEVCVNYLKDTNMLFVGGLMVAVAVEKWNLHKRIALRVLLLVGSEPRWLMFGFMITTAFLSMWISNTATTAMMVPIVQAVLGELDAPGDPEHEAPVDPDHKQAGPSGDGEDAYLNPKLTHKDKKNGDLNTGENTKDDSSVTEIGGAEMAKRNMSTGDLEKAELNKNNSSNEDEKKGDLEPMEIVVSESPAGGTADSPPDPKNSKRYKEMCKGLTLCVCYSANIGGTATLTGTGPNLVIKGQIDTLYGSETGINFSSWFVYAFPNMLMCLLLAWFWLQLMFLGPRSTFKCTRKVHPVKQNKASDVIRREYEKLGPMSFAEIAVLVHFVVLAFLWLSREPEFIPGWASLLPKGYVTDASVAITISVLLFMFPCRRPNYWCFRRKTDVGLGGPSPGLLDWPTVHQKLSWGVVLVLGGGFALAEACKVSGLSEDISNMFGHLAGLPTWGLVFILCTVTAVFTEVTSNVATATIFLPILAELAVNMHINPLYLMIPVTISTSFAFMLPVATPPNAIVFAYGHIQIKDMVKCGIVMNLVCILVLQLSINTWGWAYFDLGEFPDWASDGTSNFNATTTWEGLLEVTV